MAVRRGRGVGQDRDIGRPELAMVGDPTTTSRQRSRALHAERRTIPPSLIENVGFPDRRVAGRRMECRGLLHVGQSGRLSRSDPRVTGVRRQCDPTAPWTRPRRASSGPEDRHRPSAPAIAVSDEHSRWHAGLRPLPMLEHQHVDDSLGDLPERSSGCRWPSRTAGARRHRQRRPRRRSHTSWTSTTLDGNVGAGSAGRPPFWPPALRAVLTDSGSAGAAVTVGRMAAMTTARLADR